MKYNDPELMAKLKDVESYKPTKEEIQAESDRLLKFSDGTIKWFHVEVMSEHHSDDDLIKYGPIPGNTENAWLLMWHRWENYPYHQRAYEDLKIGPFVKFSRMPMGRTYKNRSDPLKAAKYYATEKNVPWRIVQTNGPMTTGGLVTWPSPAMLDASRMSTFNLNEFKAPLPKGWEVENIVARKKFSVIKAHRALSGSEKAEVADLVTKSISEVLRTIGHGQNG